MISSKFIWSLFFLALFWIDDHYGRKLTRDYRRYIDICRHDASADKSDQRKKCRRYFCRNVAGADFRTITVDLVWDFKR